MSLDTAFSLSICLLVPKSELSSLVRQVLETRHFGMDAEIQRPRMANWWPRQMSLQPRT